MTAIEKLKHIDKGMTNIVQWDAVSGDLLRQFCAWQKQLKIAIHELEQDAKPDKPDKEWWCETCQKPVPPNMVTFYEYHDARYGGCGFKVQPAKSPNDPN